MGKFNRKTSSKTVNLAGGQSYKQTDKLEFVSILLTSFLQDQFYRSGNETLETLQNLYRGLNDKKFAAKAAVYARTVFGMRSVSHVVAGEVANTVKGEQWTKSFFDKIIYRPDDMGEILSYYFTLNKAVPNSIKKGFASALQRFDEYKLAKYRGGNKDVSLVDIVNLVRPKATSAITALIKGTLKAADTWETKLSASNGDNDLKSKAWKGLILEKKIGYFALLRNLRNILEQAPDIIDQACALLVDENLIKKSLVLPFRFLTAIKEIQQTNFDGARKVLIALNKALDIALSNVPKFDGKTLVVLDTSGSMSGQPAEIGSVFAAILIKSNDADFITFSDYAKYQTLNPMDSTLSIAQSINFISGGTNFDAIFDEANKKYDRVIILSDMQGWMGGNTPVASFNRYKVLTGANPKIYSFDLAGYGTMQFPENNVYCLAGFSDKVFDIMKVLETDKNILLKTIDGIEL